MTKVEVLIGPVHGETDPPPIALTFKQGSRTVLRVELSPEDFALAVTGRLVHGNVTRGDGLAPPTEPQPLSEEEVIALAFLHKHSGCSTFDMAAYLGLPQGDLRESSYEKARLLLHKLRDRGFAAHTYGCWKITEAGSTAVPRLTGPMGRRVKFN